MVFKIIFTNQEDKINDFTFISGSIDDAVSELDEIFKSSIVEEGTPGHHRVVLYSILPFENENDMEGFLGHVADPDNARFVHRWFVESISEFEDDFINFHEERSLLNTVAD